MNNTFWTVLGGLAGVLVTTLGAVIIAKRKNSGHIDTSEAGELWAESQAMRRELREEVASLRVELTEARQQIVSLKKRIDELESAA